MMINMWEIEEKSNNDCRQEHLAMKDGREKDHHFCV